MNFKVFRRLDKLANGEKQRVYQPRSKVKLVIILDIDAVGSPTIGEFIGFTRPLCPKESTKYSDFGIFFGLQMGYRPFLTRCYLCSATNPGNILYAARRASQKILKVSG